MKRLRLKAVFLGFLAVMMASIIFTSCEQEQIPELGENPIVLETLTLEQNIMSGEVIDHILFLETNDFVPHYYVALGISPVAYKLDKQNPTTTDFIQLIKDAEEDSEPLKVTIDESRIFTKVVKVSETEERNWRESAKGKIWNEENIITDGEEIESRRLGPINFNNYNEVNNLFHLMNSYRCYNGPPPYTFFNGQCIPFDYKPDGCYARAHRMKELIESNTNKTCNKLIIYGDWLNGDLLSVPGCPNLEWFYHLAPYVEASGTGYIIDPSLFSQAVTVDTWAASMGTNCGLVMKDGSIYAPNTLAGNSCGLYGSYLTDPNYIHTYTTLNNYANLSGCQ